MYEVAKIEGRVRYSAFKKTIKVMITPTDSLDNLKAQLNTYFEHLGENQYTCRLFGKVSCMDLGEDRDEYAWKTASYMSWLIRDDSDVGFMFRNMVEDNILYMYVRSICNCVECKNWPKNGLKVLNNYAEPTSNITVCHTLGEGNQCADFLAKFGASSDVDLLIYVSPPYGLLNLIRSDANGTFFLRE
ncbi:hypothetical protein MTR_1g009970 [Medicago truncatula]|uniref:Uncharacterized protein n=1 Tax=Medicago truncatula TaxID=3880 RepID=A0A072VDB0_MEDTR|nr:hypothetical protein MTR_1g009970 [Medicago truncatula]